MKFRFSQLAIAALAADVSSAFLSQTTRLQNQGASRHGEIQNTFFTSTAMTATLAEGTDSVASAYDKWRGKFGKGDFDPARFESFKYNFGLLTQENLDAQDKAVSEGKNPPNWMTLNEFGDFSVEEYEALRQQSGNSSGRVIKVRQKSLR
jgi:hypothetical protein